MSLRKCTNDASAQHCSFLFYSNFHPLPMHHLKFKRIQEKNKRTIQLEPQNNNFAKLQAIIVLHSRRLRDKKKQKLQNSKNHTKKEEEFLRVIVYNVEGC